MKNFRKRSIVTQINTVVAVLLLCVNGLYLAHSIPTYRSYLQQWSADDALTFANTATAALYEAFYNEDFTKIVKFVGAAVSKSEKIKYAVVVKDDGPNLLIHGKGWHSLDEAFSDADLVAGKELPTLFGDGSVVYESAPIEMVGLHWGTFWVALDADFASSMFVRIAGFDLLMSSLIVVVSLIVLQFLSHRFNRHLVDLRDAAGRFSSGDLDARASTEGPGEIAEMGCAFNSAVTALQRSTRHLNRIGRILEESEDGLIVFSKRGKILQINKRISTLTGLDKETLLGLSILELSEKVGVDAETFSTVQMSIEENPNALWSQDLVLTSASGEQYHAHIRVGRAPGDDSVMFAIVADITHRKHLEQRLQNLAYTDELTSLPNRACFTDRVDRLVDQASPVGFALMFMDFDDFKRINDSLGHEIGDELLIEAGKRMRRAIGPDHELFRLGGDEFTVIISDPAVMRNFDNISEIADDILNSFSLPVMVSSNELHVGLSIGIACFPFDGMTRRDILRSADVAMYGAKRSGGRRYQFFTRSLGSQAMGQLATESQIRMGLKNKEFFIEYQPIVSTITGKTEMLEALVRWRRSNGEIVMPGDFISVAERTGVIVEVGRYIWETVSADFARFNELGYEGRISINVSPRELQESDFVDKLIHAFSSSQVPTTRVCLEFTESMLIDRVSESINILRRLKAAGFSLSIDDFGTGYSSLSYLNRFPIDTLKVDKSFTKRVGIDERASSIMRGIVSIAEGVGVDLVAEGVETEEQLTWLARSGFSHAQGFLMSKSLPIERLCTVLPDSASTRDFFRNSRASVVAPVPISSRRPPARQAI